VLLWLLTFVDVIPNAADGAPFDCVVVG